MKKKKKLHRSPKRSKTPPVSNYRRAMNGLQALQERLGKPPKREKIQKYVDELVKEFKLKGDSLENYFRLYAACALLNKEPLCCNWSGVHTRRRFK